MSGSDANAAGPARGPADASGCVSSCTLGGESHPEIELLIRVNILGMPSGSGSWDSDLVCGPIACPGCRAPARAGGDSLGGDSFCSTLAATHLGCGVRRRCKGEEGGVSAQAAGVGTKTLAAASSPAAATVAASATTLNWATALEDASFFMAIAFLREGKW